MLTVIGTFRSETIVLRLKAGNPNRVQVDVGNNGSPDWAFNRNRFNRIFVFALGGNDVVLIDEANGVFTDTEITTMSGDSGNDDLRGGTGAERFFGGSGNDAADGNRGDDRAFMGSGDDSFTWDPGDGSDTVEGQAGTNDALLFNGAGAAERFDVSANGSACSLLPRPREHHDGPRRRRAHHRPQALGGADTAIVNDMSGTDLANAEFDLEGRSAATPATARPTRSSSTPPTATTTSTSPPTRARWTSPVSGRP